jgi:hypothetical protein
MYAVPPTPASRSFQRCFRNLPDPYPLSFFIRTMLAPLREREQSGDRQRVTFRKSTLSREKIVMALIGKDSLSFSA